MDWDIVFAVLCLIAAYLPSRNTPVSVWLKSQSQDRLYLGPPLINRVTGVLTSLSASGLAIYTFQHASHLSVWVMWFVNMPLIVFIGYACMFFAGPREVYINLVHRTCQGASGGMFVLKEPPCRLTDKSVIYVYGGRDSGPIVLWIGGIDDPKFRLATANSREEALTFARTIGSLAQIEVQETTLAAMRGRMSARKRSQMDRE